MKILNLNRFSRKQCLNILRNARNCEYRTRNVSNGHSYYAIENTLTDNPIEHIRINSSNIEDSKDLIDKHVSEHRKQDEFYDTSDIDKIEQVLIPYLHKLKEDITPKSFRNFRSAVFRHPKERLSDYFINNIAPSFFNVFPNGEIFIINTPRILLSRSALIRFLYVLENGLFTKDIKGFNMLRSWNQVEAYSYIGIISNIILHIQFPYITGLWAWNGICLDFIFLFDEAIDTGELKQDEKIIEDIDYNAYLGIVADFAKEYVGIENIQNQPERTVYKKYLFTRKPNIEETSKLIEWSIIASSNLIAKLFNLENFISLSRNNHIDPTYAFEYSHSIQHFLRDALTILNSRSSYQNKAILFRMADILSRTASLGTLNLNEVDLFKELFMPNKILEHSYSYLDDTDLFGEFHHMADTISQHLSSTILDSIWVKDKLVDNGVLVKSRDLSTENVEDMNIFCGNLIRALRNTNHGYFTRGDKEKSRPARYFSISTGELPDDLPISCFRILSYI